MEPGHPLASALNLSYLSPSVSDGVCALSQEQGMFRILAGMRHGAVTGIACVLCSCSLIANVVPKDGPTGEAVRLGAEATIHPSESPPPYALVNLSPSVLNIVNSEDDAPTFGGFFAKGGNSTKAPLGAGDTISILLFEAQSGGLFLPPPTEGSGKQGNFVQLGNQQIDAGGSINVPYAGTLKISGKTTNEAARIISRALEKRAIEPQVVVSIVDRRSGACNVIGDVGNPTRFYLDPGGIHLLGAIARAGGSKRASFESLVTVQRHGQTAKAMLSSIIKNAALDISIEPGDTIVISHSPKVFMAFGAILQNQQIATPNGIGSRRMPFETENMTLAEGLARAGGLDPTRSDPQSVFLMRFERRETLAKLGVDIIPYDQPIVPTVYAVDLTASNGFFLMNAMWMRNMDMIVASDHPWSDTNKLAGLLQTFSYISLNSASTCSTRALARRS